VGVAGSQRSCRRSFRAYRGSPMSSERRLAPPNSTAGAKISKIPATRRDRGLMSLLPYIWLPHKPYGTHLAPR
jgi:hypothetical protein